MKLTTRQQSFCDKYRKRDAEGKVHCNECPYVLDEYGCLCIAAITKEDYLDYVEDYMEDDGR